MAARGRRRRWRIEQLVDGAGGTEEDEVRAVKVRSGRSCTTYPATTSSPEQDARRWPRIKLLRLRCSVSELGAAVGERRGHRATDQAPPPCFSGARRPEHPLLSPLRSWHGSSCSTSNAEEAPIEPLQVQHGVGELSAVVGEWRSHGPRIEPLTLLLSLSSADEARAVVELLLDGSGWAGGAPLAPPPSSLKGAARLAGAPLARLPPLPPGARHAMLSLLFLPRLLCRVVCLCRWRIEDFALQLLLFTRGKVSFAFQFCIPLLGLA
jgi:hypothetical protein